MINRRRGNRVFLGRIRGEKVNSWTTASDEVARCSLAVWERPPGRSIPVSAKDSTGLSTLRRTLIQTDLCMCQRNPFQNVCIRISQSERKICRVFLEIFGKILTNFVFFIGKLQRNPEMIFDEVITNYMGQELWESAPTPNLTLTPGPGEWDITGKPNFREFSFEPLTEKNCSHLTKSTFSILRKYLLFFYRIQKNTCSIFCDMSLF